MEWINIHRSTLEHEKLATAEPQDGWTWLRLLAYCVGQENGGVIKGAKKWPARSWIKMVGAEEDEVKRTCALWGWEGEDLQVEFYPIQKEREVKAKRSGAKVGGRLRGEQVREYWQAMAHPKAKPMAEAEAQAMANPQAQAGAKAVPEVKLQRKGREGKRMEGKRGADQSSQGSLGEIPLQEEVLAFARGWAGDMARAIAGPVDEAWALRWWAWRSGGQSPWPMDWRQDLVTRYVADEIKNRRAPGPGASGKTFTGSSGRAARPGGPSVDDINAQLQCEQDATRRAELLKKRAQICST